MVESAGRRIAAVVERDHQTNYQWEFKVIAENTVNAFALPGGKVAFYEGIMPICQTELGVAVVMGHEVAHALLRHGGERVSRSMLSQIGVSVASVLASSDPAQQEMTAAALGAAVQVGSELPFSRDQEAEADHVGLILMAKAGYDPHEAASFWRRMAAQEGGGGTPGFLRTHPTNENRIKMIEEHLPEALGYLKGR
jgi:predicted Zn-dependent protease